MERLRKKSSEARKAKMNKKSKAINKAIKLTTYPPARGSKRALRGWQKALLVLFLIALVLAFTGAIWNASQAMEIGKLPQEEIQEAPVPLEAEPLYITPAYDNEAEFLVTYYCGCNTCCGKWSDGQEHTAYGKQGTQLSPYYSIAVDPDIIPLGTICYDMEGNPYEAVDTGSKINGYHIDMFTGNHREALEHGTTTIMLYW